MTEINYSAGTAPFRRLGKYSFDSAWLRGFATAVLLCGSAFAIAEWYGKIQPPWCNAPPFEEPKPLEHSTPARARP